MSTVSARTSAATARHVRRRPLPWIALVADGDAIGALDGLGAVRRLVAPRESGRGLTVVTTEGDETPPTAVRGEIAVVFEGVLHNRQELATELALDEIDERSNAELVLAAYERWGEAMAERLRGPHALVLWDGGAQRLVASRDRMGVVPLVYSEVGSEIVLSTSADLVRRHPRVPNELNRAKLTELLCLHIFDVRETAFAAIRRLAPAHRLVRERGGGRETPNWELENIGRSTGTLDDHLDRFEALFDRAVERAVAPGDLGILLSGGIDSVSVAATAAERCLAAGIAPPLAMALVFPDPQANEEIRQRRVAEQLGLELVVRDYFGAGGGQGRSLVASAEASRKFQMPALTLWRPAYLRLLADGYAAGARTMLTGHGGDEWLGVSIYLAADYLKRLELGNLFRLYRIRRRSFHLDLLRSVYFVFWKYGARPVLAAGILRALGERGDGWVMRRKRRHFRRQLPDWVAPDPALRRELAARAERYLPPPPPGDFYDHSVRVSLDHPAGDYEYEEIFEVSRQIGISFASPYLDEELVEFLIGVPPEILHTGGRTKGLVRHSLARRFPELGFEKQKKVGGTSFFRQIIHGEGAGALDELGGPKTLIDLGAVDADRWRAYTAATFSRSPSLDIARLWFALSTEMWARSRV